MPLKRIDVLRQEIRASIVNAFFAISRRGSTRAFRVTSEYRKSRNPELVRNKLSYLREKSRANTPCCIVSRSEAARRSRRIKSERRNRQGTEDRNILRSFVRSSAHSPVHSLVQVLFVPCDSVLSSGVHTSTLECLLLADTCERCDVSARTHTCTWT